MLLISLLACADPYQKWSSCEDAGCRAEVAEEAFTHSPDKVVSDVVAMSDQLEQAVLLEQLATAHPEYRDALCQGVSDSSKAARRCEQLMLRPHLFEVRYKRSPDAGKRKAAGPSEGAPPAAEVPAFWSTSYDAAAIWEGCDEGDSGCLRNMALRRADERQAELAVQTCLEAWPEGQARSECLFQSAERLAGSGGNEELERSLAMCNAAGELVRHCAQHVLSRVLPPSCPSDRPDKQCVDDIIAATDNIKTTIGGRSGPLMADYAWGLWTRASFFTADEVTGHLLTALPAEAHPHVRMGAAWRYLQLHPPTESTTLDQVAGQLKGALAKTGPLRSSPTGIVADEQAIAGALPNQADNWLKDYSDHEAELPALYCMGIGRRAFSANPDDDLRIVALEAGAQVTPLAPAAYFTEVVGSEQAPVVQWTAARLYASSSVDKGAALKGKSQDPLVLGAIEAAQD